MVSMNLLCMLGRHKWRAVRTFHDFSSNVIEREFVCERCGKQERRYETR
ncbi:MAG: DUF1660 family phage protein [Methermicoccaceae archaeon]